MEVRGAGSLYTDAEDWCHVFVDVRLLPDTGPEPALASLARALRGVGFPVEITIVDHRRGHVARGAGELVRATRAAHRAVFGTEPPPPAEAQVSMWQDTNTFNGAGIPAVSYGIRPIAEPYTRERFRAARIADLVALARVYAQTAVAFAGSTPMSPSPRESDRSVPAGATPAAEGAYRAAADTERASAAAS